MSANTVNSSAPPPLPGSRWKRFRSLLISGLVLAAAGAGVVAVNMMPDPPPPPAPAAPPPKLVRVQVVQPHEIVDSFILPGVVEANRVVKVAAEVAGRIEKIHVREGQDGTKDQLLVELNTDLLQAEYDRTKAQSEFDARDLERVSDLAKRGVATTAELDQSRTKAAAGKAAFDAAAANLRRAKIVAPIPGVINSIPVEQGEYVTAGMTVVEIVDIDPVKVAVDVPERDAPWVQLAQDEKIFLEGRFAREIVAPVSYICELADPKTRTTRVELSVKNPLLKGARVLRSGQIVRVEMRRRLIADAILIPLEAVIPQEENGQPSYAVYVVEDGKAVRKNVRLGVLKGGRNGGAIKDTQVQIVSGLAAGDRLIVANQRYVGPGQAVLVQGRTPAEAKAENSAVAAIEPSAGHSDGERVNESTNPRVNEATP